MITKKFLTILCSGLLSFSVFACLDDSSSNPAPDAAPDAAPADVQAMSTEIYLEVSNALGAAMSGKKSIDKGSGVFNYSGAGYTVTGSYSYNDTTTYPMTYDLTMTFTGFVSGNVRFQSGSINLVLYEPSASQFSYDYTGTFVVVYKGITYNMSWTISMDYISPNYTYSGTYAVNGVTYNFAYGK